MEKELLSKNLKILSLMFLALLMFLPSAVFADEIINANVNAALSEYKDEIGVIANYMIAFSAVSSVLVFIIHFVRLGGYHAHSIMRKKVIQDIMVSAACTGIIGAFGLFFKIYLEIFMT